MFTHDRYGSHMTVKVHTIQLGLLTRDSYEGSHKVARAHIKQLGFTHDS